MSEKEKYLVLFENDKIDEDYIEHSPTQDEIFIRQPIIL